MNAWEGIYAGGLAVWARPTGALLPVPCPQIVAAEVYSHSHLSAAGADETLMGLDIALACLTEAPIFFFAGAIVEKLGVNRALNISAVAFAAR